MRINHDLDLFGEVIITHHDVFMWVCVVTFTRFIGRRYEWYIQNYAVINKIDHCKRSGDWPKIEREYMDKYAAILKDQPYSANLRQ